jgi:hypothetical protein
VKPYAMVGGADYQEDPIGEGRWLTAILSDLFIDDVPIILANPRGRELR